MSTPEDGPSVGAQTTPATPGLARSGAVMAAGTLASRVLGMLKGSLLTATLGVGVTGGVFTVANTLPNNFYILLAGGVLNAILVPQIAKAASHDDGGEDFVNRLLTLALVLMAGATVLATAAAPLLVRLYASDKLSSDAIALGITFAFICLPQIFFYGLYTLLGQVLNARGHFAAYMWAPVVANVVAIGGLVWYLTRGLPRRAPPGTWNAEMVWAVAGGATLGIVLQALVLLIPLRRIGFRYRPTWGFRGVGLRSASRVALWTFAAVAVSQLGFIVTSQVLTHADAIAGHGVQAAGLNVYSNAFILFMLPHSLVTVSLVTALFTRMSYAAQQGRRRDVLHDLDRGLRMPAVLLIPATFAGVLLAPWATNAIYLGNTITETDAIAHVMTAMLLGLVPYGWLYLIQRVFYAYEDARTPFNLQLLVTVVATAFNLASIALPPQWVGVGVGVGQTVGNLAAAALGFVLIRRRLGRLRLRGAVQQNIRLVVASAVAMAVAGAALLLMRHVLGVGRVAVVTTLLVDAVIFLVVVLVAAARLRVREVHEVLGPLFRRLGRASA